MTSIPYRSLSPEYQKRIRCYIRERQNFRLALFMGLLTSVICSLVWYVFAINSGIKVGWIALGIGIAVGYSVWHAGKGISEKFGLLGAGLSILSILFGHFLIAEHTLRTHSPDLYKPLNVFITALNNSSLYDIVFMILAGLEGFKFGMKTEVEAREGLDISCI